MPDPVGAAGGAGGLAGAGADTGAAGADDGLPVTFYRGAALPMTVGTRCWIILMLGRDGSDPLFLQVKEAEESVLCRFRRRRQIPRTRGSGAARGASG